MTDETRTDTDIETATDAADAALDLAHDLADLDTVDVDLADAPTTRVTHIVPEPLRDAAQERAEHGELSERVRELYRLVATDGVADARSQLQLELERVRAEKDDLRAERERIDAELRTLERREQRLEERIDRTESREDRYEGHLESLGQRVRDGEPVWAEHPAIEEAASVAGIEPAAVIEDLRERHPDLPERAFVRQDTLPIDDRWTGVDR